jgi:acetylglutamate kinase
MDKKECIKVIKIGGAIINDDKVLASFLKSFATISGPKILVHGGGVLATELAAQMNVPVRMIAGRRVTDVNTLDIITMVYAGKINKNVVATLQKHKCNALGFSGADGNTIIAKKRPTKPINFGYVGDVVKVDVTAIKALISHDFTPVFCAISHNSNGQLLNTNADTIASELAIALAKNYTVELYYCFEKKGVLKTIKDEDSVISHIDINTYEKLKKDGVIFEGMLPKMENCFYALKNQVAKVCIGQAEMLFEETHTHTTLTL